MGSPRNTTKNSPHSPQLEKARAQQRGPNAAKDKLINLFIYFKKKRYDEVQDVCSFKVPPHKRKVLITNELLQVKNYIYY